MEKPWACCRSGDCCTRPGEVVLTHAERSEIERAVPSGVVLSFRDDVADARFVRLQAGPCPLYRDGGCSVYAVRPFNCRRFACGRADVSAEPFTDGVPARFFSDRAFRRQAVLIQRKASSWARAHGWEN